jgi:hypothetical protein
MQKREAAAAEDDAPTVKKTKLLLGLKDEVIKLKLTVSEEQAEREKISEWLKSTLRPSLQRMNTNVSSKFEELEAELAQEVANRSKINEWLKCAPFPSPNNMKLITHNCRNL